MVGAKCKNCHFRHFQCHLKRLSNVYSTFRYPQPIKVARFATYVPTLVRCRLRITVLAFTIDSEQYYDSTSENCKVVLRIVFRFLSKVKEQCEVSYLSYVCSMNSNDWFTGSKIV